MARVIGGTPADPWERQVKKELQMQLPESWVVICDISYSWRENSGFIRDGQADFAILVPHRGLVILEVKGSRGVSVSASGEWMLTKRNGDEISIAPPPEQATKNLHNLTTKLADLLGYKNFPGLFGWMVVYPNGLVKGPLEMYHPNSVVSKRDMGSLKKVILASLTDRGSDRTGNQFDLNLMNKCATFLVNGNFVVEHIDTNLDADETERCL